MAQSPDVFRRKIWQTPTRVFVVPELRLFATGGFLERPETTVFEEAGVTARGGRKRNVMGERGRRVEKGGEMGVRIRA
ncbi:hypothetical protein E2C01_006770 [Portunus trituberculatus]|uniref:Uncharacterized protein n=1 Tax=Portunus trituberculatus TaxID=210409 RepID=A0A5B7CW01_PORTR|nr:hypothetical protein [Portunus trituberculatus]